MGGNHELELCVPVFVLQRIFVRLQRRALRPKRNIELITEKSECTFRVQ